MDHTLNNPLIVAALRTPFSPYFCVQPRSEALLFCRHGRCPQHGSAAWKPWAAARQAGVPSADAITIAVAEAVASSAWMCCFAATREESLGMESI